MIAVIVGAVCIALGWAFGWVHRSSRDPDRSRRCRRCGEKLGRSLNGFWCYECGYRGARR